jgi:hypothetical protein
MKILLISAYVSLLGDISITSYEMQSQAECQRKAAEIFNNVKAGSARVWCQKVYDSAKQAKG